MTTFCALEHPKYSSYPMLLISAARDDQNVSPYEEHIALDLCRVIYHSFR